ncbi:MAG: hypothetical protein KC466_07855 [Myxococcales bacterium]|nr:hypothetical protein [Myxococcales bacterium]
MIFRLDVTTPLDVAVLGGKGAGLVRLIRAGIPVPEVWCIPADAEDTPDGAPSDALIEALADLWKDLLVRAPAAAWAVRGSATTEDLEGASAAGIYETVLGVESLEALVDAVGVCRRALHSERARAYRAERGQTEAPRMAVLLQRLVPATASGVMLTANPQRAFAREIVIEATWGMGETLVAGRTEPDRVILHRATGEVRERRLGAKEREGAWARGKGVVERDVPPERRAAVVIDDARRIALFDLAWKITAKIGPRRDIEWAFEGDTLWALQVRPITGLPPEVPENVWTRKFGDEYLADYSMPLSRDLLVKWIAEDYLGEMARLMGREDLLAIEPLREHHGYSYMNGAYVAALMEGVPRGMRGGDVFAWFTPLWRRRLSAVPYRPSRTLAPLRATARDRERAPIARNVTALARHCEAIEREIVPLLTQDYDALDAGRWRAQFDRAHALGSEHFRVIRWGMGLHNPFLHAALADRLARWCGDADGALYQAAVSGLAGTRTQELNREVWRLGGLARADESLARRILAGEPYVEARAATRGAPLWEAFDAFIDRYGHRAAAREISRPRWREDPEVVLAFVRAQLRGRPPADPAELEQKAADRRERAVRRILASVGWGPRGLVRRRVLRWLIHWAHIYTRYREDQRFHLDYLLQHIRNLVLAQGRRFVRMEIVDDPADVFFLDGPTMWSLVDDPRPRAGLRETIAERRAHWRVWRNRRPATYLFDGVETEGEIVEGDPDPKARPAEHTGYGASRGVARGRARVVHDLHDLGAAEPGEILVASNIDPGWTHVFPILAGLVTETGGTLSHGALLAREYGIPAVMGIVGATGRFRTGEWLSIDGTAGTVTRAVKKG